MLSYFKPIKSDNIVYSIDNIVCDYKLDLNQLEKFYLLLSNLEFKYSVEVAHWNTYNIGTYRYQFSIKHSGVSFWIGCGLNEGKTNWNKIRIEYNPNKIFKFDFFQCVLSFLNINSKLTVVKRFDLAIDYPCQRESCYMIKDNRIYSEFAKSSSNRTQYLGDRSNVGYCKLYNKQIESDLISPLTRLELTLSPTQFYDDINMPKVYYVNDLQQTFDELTLNETEKYILSTLLQDMNNINMLGYRMRKKMEVILEQYTSKFELPKKIHSEVLDCIRGFVDFPINENECSEPNIAHERYVDMINVKHGDRIPKWVHDCIQALLDD